jgi:cytochrome o ubiquinol oxidase subunit IV
MSHSDPDLEPDVDVEDLSPGVMDTAAVEPGASLQRYVIGLALAALLTVISFYVVGSQLIWEPGIPVALAVLAIAQIGVHLIFFLHVTSGPENTNNVLALAFGVLIVGLVVGGSIWIMAHLNQNMMTMDQMM